MNSLTVLGLIFALILVVQAELSEDEKKFIGIAEECWEKHGATEDDKQEMIEKKCPTSKVGKCSLACIMKKSEMMKADNTANCEGLSKVENVDAEKMGKFMEICETCKKQDTTDECEAAAMMCECGKKQAQTNGMM